MNKKLLIAIIIILIIIIALVCIFNLKPRNKESTIATGETLESTNTIEDSENNTTSNSLLEVSNKAENTIKETDTIENESSKDNSNNTDSKNRISKNEQKNNTITTTNNNTKEETKDKTNNNNSSNTNNEIENTDKQNSDTNKEDNQPKEQDKNEEQQEQQEEINTELANKHFTKYNAEKTAHAVNYLNNLIKSQSDYDEFGGYAIAVTSKPTSDWFSYSDYKLNGLALSGYIVKVYIEDEYAHNSRGTSYSLYDTKAYVYQEFMD